MSTGMAAAPQGEHSTCSRPKCIHVFSLSLSSLSPSLPQYFPPFLLLSSFSLSLLFFFPPSSSNSNDETNATLFFIEEYSALTSVCAKALGAIPAVQGGTLKGWGHSASHQVSGVHTGQKALWKGTPTASPHQSPQWGAEALCSHYAAPSLLVPPANSHSGKNSWSFPSRVAVTSCNGK